MFSEFRKFHQFKKITNVLVNVFKYTENDTESNRNTQNINIQLNTHNKTIKNMIELTTHSNLSQKANFKFNKLQRVMRIDMAFVFYVEGHTA